MKLSEMRQLLAESDIRLTKSLGQNFLHDANQLRRIIEAGELKQSDKVLEIGPGLGPLTVLLLQEADEVLAIEKDARLVEVLRNRFKVGQASSLSPASDRTSETEQRPLTKTETGWKPVLRLIHDDALDFLRREQRDWREWKLVANLPYSVASPILVELAQNPLGPRRMAVTLQIEVAKRLMAKPTSPDYGALTLLVQLNYEPRGWFKIPASCFFPEPEVDSACVSLLRRSQPLLALERRDTFVRIVKRSFSQRRKMMFKLLKEHWPTPCLEKALAQSHVPLHARAETVSLEQFVRLAQLLPADSACE
jgi:16S rRNA (adenine1518-N6/adenine1519-N6)-dimethyltransferase